MGVSTGFAELVVDELQQQRCKACWRADGFNFHVPDEIWLAVAPEALRGSVLCLACFDRMAAEAGVEYATHLREVCFAGRVGRLEFHVTAAADGPLET